MFLHIGNSKNIRQKNIIGIFDADTAPVSGVTRRFLREAEKRGDVTAAGREVPKSFVLYRKKNGCGVCFSQLSSVALLGRLDRVAGADDNKI